MKIIGIILLILSLGVTVMLIMSLILWQVHKEMVRNNCKIYGVGNYEQFKQEFFKYKNWKTDDMFPGSFFGERLGPDHYYIHADIIKFDGKGMILDWWSYQKYAIWQRKLKKAYKRSKGSFNWTKENER